MGQARLHKHFDLRQLMGTMREGKGEAGVLRSREGTYVLPSFSLPLPHPFSHSHISPHTPTSLFNLPYPFHTPTSLLTLLHSSFLLPHPSSHSPISPQNPTSCIRLLHPSSSAHTPRGTLPPPSPSPGHPCVQQQSTTPEPR